MDEHTFDGSGGVAGSVMARVIDDDQTLTGVRLARLASIADLDSSRDFEYDGYPSATAFLVHKCGMSGGEAKREVFLARSLQHMAYAVKSAYAGHISVTQLELLAYARSRHPEQFQDEPWLAASYSADGLSMPFDAVTSPGAVSRPPYRYPGSSLRNGDRERCGRMGMRTGVCTDSVACIPPRDAEELGVEVVPFPVLFGTRSYGDGVDMSPEEFYSRLAVEEELPTTSAPSPADYEAACVRLAEGGCDEAVIVALSDRLSMAVDNARTAAREAPIPVHVVDSRMAAAPEGLLARAAARMGSEGASGREIVDELDRLRPHSGMLAVIPDLRYLRRGGRIGRLAGFAGERLGIRPLVTFVDGEVGSAGMARSIPDAYDRMIKRLLELAAAARTLEVAVMEAAAQADAALLREQVEAEVSPALLDDVPFTPVMGVHTGPGVVGVAWLAPPR